MWKYAFSLSKAEVDDATPLGTVEIFHEPESGQASRLIKFPHPTTDIRDPLNFSRSRKTGALVVASVFAFVANFTSSVIAPALQLWPRTFPEDPRPFSELAYLIAVSTVLPSAYHHCVLTKPVCRFTSFSLESPILSGCHFPTG